MIWRITDSWSWIRFVLTIRIRRTSTTKINGKKTKKVFLTNSIRRPDVRRVNRTIKTFPREKSSKRRSVAKAQRQKIFEHRKVSLENRRENLLWPRIRQTTWKLARRNSERNRQSTRRHRQGLPIRRHRKRTLNVNYHRNAPFDNRSKTKNILPKLF